MQTADLAARVAEARKAFEAIPASRETAARKRAALEHYLLLRDGPRPPKATLPRPIGFKR
jgi:hypothetical protein